MFSRLYNKEKTNKWEMQSLDFIIMQFSQMSFPRCSKQGERLVSPFRLTAHLSSVSRCIRGPFNRIKRILLLLLLLLRSEEVHYAIHAAVARARARAFSFVRSPAKRYLQVSRRYRGRRIATTMSSRYKQRQRDFLVF